MQVAKDFHLFSIPPLSYIFTDLEEIVIEGMATIIKLVLAAGTVLDIHMHYLIKPPFYRWDSSQVINSIKPEYESRSFYFFLSFLALILECLKLLRPYFPDETVSC